MIATIDGKACQFEPGEFLLTVAERNGIHIPTLCHHAALAGQASCRVCIVELEEAGHKSVAAACVYPLSQDCVVETNSPRIREQRGLILALLRSRAPESAEIAALCEEYNAPEISRFKPLDSGSCILCGLCVKACESLGSGAISTMWRGIDKKISTPYDEASPDCIGCLSCAETCPTGHIQYSRSPGKLHIWEKDFKVLHCTVCGVPLGTPEALAYAAQSSGQELDQLCPECRRLAITDELAHAYGISIR